MTRLGNMNGDALRTDERASDLNGSHESRVSVIFGSVCHSFHRLPTDLFEEQRGASQHLRTELQSLQDRRLYVKFSNCEFWLDKVVFLGHIISRDGVEVDPSKVDEVQDWPVPKSVTEIRSFLGFAGYCRKFIQGFSSISVPITTLMKKNAKFVWRSECQENFDRLKQALTSAPVLAMPSGQGEL
ncbi:uncharacterized mitochondrial protein AtMg00860-like [Primulina eburnea]|uniref:uncharacterized mitochondrial protein AtMg00860-like n=1 Tax=Primulina eburnea TaxID=1245227 RepID=UPI003C6C1284